MRGRETYCLVEGINPSLQNVGLDKIAVIILRKAELEERFAERKNRSFASLSGVSHSLDLMVYGLRPLG